MKHKISLLPHGCKAGTPPQFSPKAGGLRGAVGGWSDDSSRRNVDFLRSVDENSLTGLGLAFTGTLKDCPQTSDDWHKIRKSFEMRLRRMGLIRGHWVTEWQRRGVPHLHCALWFPESDSVRLRIAVTEHWLAVTKEFGSSTNGQYALMINDAIGWFQYVAKHAARGVKHYQRSPENIPLAWKKKTGRVWGKVGEWVTVEPLGLYVPSDVFHRFRRACRGWRLADARASGNVFRIKSARNMLSCSERKRSEVRGLSEWLPIETAGALAVWACEQSENLDDVLSC